MDSLSNLGAAINAAIRQAKDSDARLERHGDVIILREGTRIYALGLLDNGDARYFDGES